MPRPAPQSDESEVAQAMSRSDTTRRSQVRNQRPVQLIAARHERRSLLITANTPFG
jgi:hypothetical protein